MVNKLAPVKFASLLMGVWFLSTASANKFAGTLSALYPEAVVSLTDVEAIEKEKTVQLFPEGFEKKNAQDINGTKVIPFEKVNFANIKDEASKTEAIKNLEKKQVENIKTFIGYPIANLYDFFMLFVVMAGVASVILFVLSKKLLQMMHGVR